MTGEAGTGGGILMVIKMVITTKNLKTSMNS